MTKNELKKMSKKTLLKALEEACTYIEGGPEVFSPQFMIDKALGKSEPVKEEDNDKTE